MKTVITDLDGTLLDNGELSNKTIEVLKEFQKDNHLILATGRNLKSVEHIYQQLDMNKYQTGGLIVLNGLEFYDFSDGEHIHLESFSLKTTKRLVFILHLLLFRVTVVGKEQRVTLNSLYDRLYYLLRYIIKHKPMKRFEKIEYPQEIEKLEISGTIFFSFFVKVLKILFRNYEVVFVNKYWVEILPKGTNKVNQVKYYINKYNINLNDLYVFGDGENDIEMLKYAYNSYAPIGCLDKAKLVAKHDCASCKDDGVARIVNEIMK